MKDIRYYINLIENDGPANPSRRGFLKKAGAGVAVAGAVSLDPTGTIAKNLVKDLGLNNLSALDQVLKVATPADVLGFFNYRLSSGIWEDAITDEEWKLAQQKLPNEYVNDWVTNQFDEGKDGLEELSKLIGRPLTMDKIAKVLEKNQIDYDDPDSVELNKLNDSLADLAYGDGKWSNAQDAGKDTAPAQSSIPGGDAAKSTAVRILIRSAFFLAKKLMSKPEAPTTDIAPPETPSNTNIPALPAPTKSEYDDLLTPELDKEKPEFNYWDPAKDSEPDKKFKKS